MLPTSDDTLLPALLDSWSRNNRILVNLLRAVSDEGLRARATETSPTVAQLFAHIHYVRLVFVAEDAPECAVDVPRGEWTDTFDRERMAAQLDESAAVLGRAVEGRLRASRDMDLHYDHPILMLQHMVWHEGYHHGQIKLALKQIGQPLDDRAIGRLTWGVWMRKT